MKIVNQMPVAILLSVHDAQDSLTWQIDSIIEQPNREMQTGEYGGTLKSFYYQVVSAKLKWARLIIKNRSNVY